MCVVTYAAQTSGVTISNLQLLSVRDAQHQNQADHNNIVSLAIIQTNEPSGMQPPEIHTYK